MAAIVSDQRAYRLTSIDLLRGLVIAIMAIDHVRDNFLLGTVQDPMNDPNVGLAVYFTRWITHVCAPTFTLLAGTSAGLMAARRSPGDLGRFLLTRGLWLLFIEAVVISTALTFSPFGMPEMHGRILLIEQTIWAIGASMVVLAGAQFMGRNACLAVGGVILIAHNLLDSVWPASTALDTSHPLWVAMHAPMSYTAGPFELLFAYPLLPWIGVMLVGFGGAAIFELPAAQRDAALRRWGFTMIAMFILLRASQGYGDPNPWQSQPSGAVSTLLDFLNTTKYPPSLLFLLMTLGPAAVFCSYADRMHGFLKDSLVMLGRVPFAFYVTHFFVIHLLAMLLGVLQGFHAGQFATLFFFYPKGYGVPLESVYLVWLLVLAILYPFCRWVAAIKARRRDWWLSYL